MFLHLQLYLLPALLLLLSSVKTETSHCHGLETNKG